MPLTDTRREGHNYEYDHCKIAFVADIHVANHSLYGGPKVGGINTRCRQTLDAIRKSLDTAIDNECVAWVCAGDLLDHTSPEPQILAELANIFNGYAADDQFEIHLLVGNHDRNSMSHGDHALTIFNELEANIHIHEQPDIFWIRSRAIGFIPFLVGDSSKLVPEALNKLITAAAPYPLDIAVIHAGIADEMTPSFLQNSHDCIAANDLLKIMDGDKLKAFIAGNWHNHRVWNEGKGMVIQCGALVPTGWDNPGGDDLYGKTVMVLVEEDRLKVDIATIPGPRFIKATTVEQVKAAKKSKLSYVSATIDKKEAEELKGMDTDFSALALHVTDEALKDTVQDIRKRGADCLETAIDIEATAYSVANSQTDKETIKTLVNSFIQRRTV